MTLPNILTLSRIILTFLFVVFISLPGIISKLIATIIFIVAAFTDFYDGHYAKKHNLVTNFGKIMDPVADKFLILTVFYIFLRMHLIALWMFVVILVREVMITGLRVLAITKGQVLPAEKKGKYKTSLQILTAFIILIFITLQETLMASQWSEGTYLYWHIGIAVLLMCTVILTLYSGIVWLWHNKKFIYGQ